jgi:hypothetical protein
VGGLNDRDPENEPCGSKKERGCWFEPCKPKSKKHQGQSPEKSAGNGISTKDKADYKKKKRCEKSQKRRLCQGNVGEGRDINKRMSKIAGKIKIRVTAMGKSNAKRLQKDQAEAEYAAQGYDSPFL